jgi:hypothetical protein
MRNVSRWAVSVAVTVLLVVVVLGPRPDHPLSADATVTTLVNGAATTGRSAAAIFAASTPGDTGIEQWMFLKTGTGQAFLDVSLDSGVSWSHLYEFKGNPDTFRWYACGGCRFSISYVATATNTVTVKVSQSGIIVPSVPTSTQTPTFTATLTRTVTPTATRTYTATITPTVTKTPTRYPTQAPIYPAVLPTRTMTPTPTNTPTATNTATRTPTPT